MREWAVSILEFSRCSPRPWAAQGTDQFSNRTFDPTDDGNDEDSFFSDDPTETTGPSSTCFPEFPPVRLKGRVASDMR